MLNVASKAVMESKTQSQTPAWLQRTHESTGNLYVDSMNGNAGSTSTFESDKQALYRHPLFPLLAILLERCEAATQGNFDRLSESDLGDDLQAFFQHYRGSNESLLADDPEVDGLMVKALQVLRIHLLELKKVNELCSDFCERYINCLKVKMHSDNLLRGTEDGYESGDREGCGEKVSYAGLTSNISLGSQGYNDTFDNSPLSSSGMDRKESYDANSRKESSLSHYNKSLSTFGGSSEDDDDSSNTFSEHELGNSKKTSKRSVLPRKATAILRTWLFQHLGHPYPTEDEKRAMASQTQLTLLQVNNWFINARRRILQPMIDQAQAEGVVGVVKKSVKGKATGSLIRRESASTSSGSGSEGEGDFDS